MASNQFKSFLSSLGYSDLLPKEVSNSFHYTINTDNTFQSQLTVPYYYFKTTEELFKKHLEVWNRNNCPSFIAIFDDRSIIIDSRQKPDNQNYLPKPIIIESFNYGVNTRGYDISKHLHLISKVSIDTSEFFSYVINLQKKKKASEVDKELLINLLSLRKDLSATPNEKIDLLILRSIFVKYLEDRGVFQKDTLINSFNSAEQLIRTFSKVRKINGDLFSRKELSPNDIHSTYLEKLSDFFGYTDYQKKQIKFFPYQFDKIPIQLISHIYESFLSEEAKKGSGIYYTPSFLVDFMLAQTLRPKLEENKKATFFDPACGSAAYLVSAFRMIVNANNAEKNYEKKKELLQKQIFGIDVDERALPIAAFSLYLALLEGEDPGFIQEKIENEHPILPSLIGSNLIRANSLTDDVVFKCTDGKTITSFDCICANPPWGSVPPEDDSDENLKTRDTFDKNDFYKNVSDYQRSQAFLLRTKVWSHKESIASMVVNNSIFLNENGEEFRKELLNNYNLERYYELSDIDSILFKKKIIGTIKKKDVVIGANEPCSVLVYNEKYNANGKFQYITPRLNGFTKYLNIISYCQKDIRIINQQDIQIEDLLWRVFANGDWNDYQIIKKRINGKEKSLTIKCDIGFQPKNNMKSLGKAKYRTIIDLPDFARYRLIKKPRKFNWNQTLHRSRTDATIYVQPRILIPIRPLISDGLKLRGLYVDGDVVFKDNIASIRVFKNDRAIENYKPYLAIVNSRFIGFLLYQLSSQWGKGNKRVRLSTTSIENIPFPSFEYSDSNIKKLSKLVEDIEQNKSAGKDVTDIENKIDEIVFDLYHLTEYERTVVNEFYETFYRYENSQERVNKSDLDRYANCFRDVLRLMLSNDYDLTCKHKISQNLGTIMCFAIQDKKKRDADNQFDCPEVLEIVKKAQLKKAFVSSALAEEKVKYYDNNQQRFYIIKSNQYRDWTERQAIDDANEEIGNFINYLRGR